MRRHLLLLAAVAATACSDPSGPGRGDPGIRFVSGNNVTDTIGAEPIAALIVEVRDLNGRIMPVGTVVRFTGVRTDESPFGFGIEMAVQALTSNSFSNFVSAETDANGRTGVLVKFGNVVGPARIAVSVPEIGVEDTARFMVTPGQPALITILPADTALYAGRTYSLRGGVTDRVGNVRTDPVSYTTSGTGVTVTSAGVVSTSAVGRYTITATAGTATRTAGVSVIPEATIAAVRGDFFNSRLVTVNLDGSDLRDLIAVASDFDVRVWPRWIPGTNTIIHSHRDPATQLLRTVDLNGTATPFLPSRPPTMTNHAEPSPAVGAPVVYFSAFDSRCSGIFYCLHRSNRDGSNPELLGTFIATGEVTWRPSSSPDGSRVAFVTTGTFIKVFDYATKTVSAWSVPGQHPSWSPDGSTIAYVPQHGGTMRLINPDGSNQRVLGTRTYGEAPISWSADSRWILARGDTWDLIEVGTGLVLPLPHLNALREASLK